MPVSTERHACSLQLSEQRCTSTSCQSWTNNQLQICCTIPLLHTIYNPSCINVKYALAYTWSTVSYACKESCAAGYRHIYIIRIWDRAKRCDDCIVVETFGLRRSACIHKFWEMYIWQNRGDSLENFTHVKHNYKCVHCGRHTDTWSRSCV